LTGSGTPLMIEFQVKAGILRPTNGTPITESEGGRYRAGRFCRTTGDFREGREQDMKRMISLRHVGIAIVLLALVMPGVAMGGQPKGTIKIATQSPLSGDQSAVG